MVKCLYIHINMSYWLSASWRFSILNTCILLDVRPCYKNCGLSDPLITGKIFDARHFWDSGQHGKNKLKSNSIHYSISRIDRIDREIDGIDRIDWRIDGIDRQFHVSYQNISLSIPQSILKLATNREHTHMKMMTNLEHASRKHSHFVSSAHRFVDVRKIGVAKFCVFNKFDLFIHHKRGV